MQKTFSVFAQNLAYYNEGGIEGGWLDLPQTSEAINKYLKEVVKVDEEHEEYEIADVENIYPFPYSSIQWSSLQDINNLAIIYGSLDECEKEAVEAYLESEGAEKYNVNDFINICLQARKIEYYQYYFDGIDSCKDCSPSIKMGYTMAEENGLYQELEKIGALDYFDFEKYGDSYSYDYQLFEKGYLEENTKIDLNFYSKEEIAEKANEILKNYLKEEEKEIEV